MATLPAMGVLEVSPLRNPDQVPFSDPPPSAQDPPGVTDEEETPNMRELVQAIDSHVELVDLEVTSGPHVGAQSTEDIQIQQPPTAQLAKDVIEQPAEDTSQLPPTDPSA